MNPARHREIPVWESRVLDDLSVQLGDSDGGMTAEIVSTYLAQARELVGRIESAVESSDALGLRDAAHSLRGSSLTVGGARLGALCERIELGGDAESQEAAGRARQEFDALASQLESRSTARPTRSSQGPR